MKIIALDLSLRSTGVAGLGWTSRVAPPSRLVGHARLRYILGNLRMLYRGADLVVIEGPAYGAGGSSRHQLAGLWWLVAHDVVSRDIPYAVVDPKSLKMYATDNGSADKALVTSAVREWHPNVDISGPDEADAYTMLCLAYAAYELPMECCPHLAPMPPHARSQRAVDNVTWPDVLRRAA